MSGMYEGPGGEKLYGDGREVDPLSTQKPAEGRHVHAFKCQQDGYKVCGCGATRPYTLDEAWDAMVNVVERGKRHWFNEDFPKIAAAFCGSTEPAAPSPAVAPPRDIEHVRAFMAEWMQQHGYSLTLLTDVHAHAALAYSQTTSAVAPPIEARTWIRAQACSGNRDAMRFTAIAEREDAIVALLTAYYAACRSKEKRWQTA